MDDHDLQPFLGIFFALRVSICRATGCRTIRALAAKESETKEDQASINSLTTITTTHHITTTSL